MCPYCKSNQIKKNGFFSRVVDGRKVQRFKCKSCSKNFSDQTFRLDYRHRKPHINQEIFLYLSSGVSQRRLAINLSVNKKTVDIRIDRFGEFCKNHMKAEFEGQKLDLVQFDEMESWIHTKLKPVTMPIFVEPVKRKIISLDVGDIAAKGKLASISVEKYGKRKCERSTVLYNTLEEVKPICEKDLYLVTDRSPHYPTKIKNVFPESTHIKTKGRRGCVVGQGELKRAGFDPIFSLNHTYAMIRYNLKRLARRTWTTSKRKSKLKSMLYICACYHNQYVDDLGYAPQVPMYL